MYDNTIPDLNDGTVDHDYSIVSIEPYKSIRREAAAALDQPALLTISHQTSGSGLATRTRSLVRLDRTVEDGDGNQGMQSAYLVIDSPDKITSTAILKNSVNELIDFLGTATYVDKLLAREI